MYYPAQRQDRRYGCGCLFWLGSIILLAMTIVYFIAPGKTNILLLGIDLTPSGTVTGRSDSIVLTQFVPIEPYVGMLSIPRDLWVVIPGIGENRINTAHFFAELNQPGSGPEATLETIAYNFGLEMDYYARIRFEGIVEVVDALGGVEIQLDKPLGGYPPGKYLLHGRQALTFARNRRGSDDFYRMQQGQILLKAMLNAMLQPENWTKLPAVLLAVKRTVNTNIPVWLWPRLGLVLIRVGANGLDNRVLDREYVIPYTTDQGASVLLPRWELIRPAIEEMFGPQ